MISTLLDCNAGSFDVSRKSYLEAGLGFKAGACSSVGEIAGGGILVPAVSDPKSLLIAGNWNLLVV